MISGVECDRNIQVEFEVKKEDMDTVSYNPVWTSFERASIQDETIKPMSMKTETYDQDTHETATHVLPQIRECKNEDRTSSSVTGEGKDKDANMTVSYIHNDDSKNASDKCLVFKAETGVLCDVIELIQKHGLINSKEKAHKITHTGEVI